MTEVLDTKDRIRQQASDLFMKYGVRSISMDDIANSLGMSKKTIYQYFTDKDELVDAVILVLLGHNQQDCELDRVKSKNAIHELFLALDMVLELFQTMNPSIIYDIQKYHPNSYLKFQKHKNDYLFNNIRDNLVRGIQEDLFRPEINVEVVARFRVESMLVPLNPEFQARVKHNLVEIEEELLIHYLFGVVNLKGYQMVLNYLQERTKNLSGNAKN